MQPPLWSPQQSQEGHLQLVEDQLHPSQSELPQQVSELAHHRVVYGADVLTVQEHRPRWWHCRRGRRKMNEQICLKERLWLMETSLSPTVLRNTCVLWDNVKCVVKKRIKFTLNGVKYELITVTVNLYGYPAEPGSAARGWGALQRGSWGHCRVPSPAHHHHAPALDSSSHTETHREQVMNNHFHPFFSCITEFSCFSIIREKTQSDWDTKVSVETWHDGRKEWLLIITPDCLYC